MKIATALSALLLLALLCVPAASAGGMVKFHVSPVADPEVGDTVTVTIYNDNNLAPKIGDVVLMLDWNPEVMRYASSTVEQGNTKAADPIATHFLEIRAADTVNGLPNGDGALATVKFRIVGPGFTPIVIDVRSVHDVAGADISSRAVASNGAVTATGTAAKGPTAAPTTVATTVAAGTMPVPTVTGAPPAPVAVVATPEAVVTVEPVVVSPDGSPEALPTVTPAGSARPRFGTRTYLVGTVPKNPPVGIAGGSGRAVGLGTGRSRIGTGIATGVRPPTSRFVRWSPVTRWRTHAV